MSLTSPAPLPPDGALTQKRKNQDTAGSEPLPKKKRIAPDPQGQPLPPLEPYEHVLTTLRMKYEVKTMSVLSSTSLCKHIDNALAHLGRFSFLDDSVLPGVILLYAKSKAANKVVTIAETIRRRIAEGDHKWYQYNLLYEVACPDGSNKERSVVEDSLLATTEDNEDEAYRKADDHKPTVFENAIEPVRARHEAVMGIFISRIPVVELLSLCRTGLQSNSHEIEEARRREGSG